MPKITVIPPESAKGELKEVYDGIGRSRGNIAQIFQVQSLNPKALKAHHELYIALLYGESLLSRRERELLGVVTSRINNCEYCINHHSDALGRYLNDPVAIEALRTGNIPATLSGRERALVDWAEKLGRTAPTIKDEDIGILRSTGFTDAEIVDATMIVGYFHFVNRIATSLGVELEPREEQKYKY